MASKAVSTTSFMACSVFDFAFRAAVRTKVCFRMKLVPELIAFTITGIGFSLPFRYAYPLFA